MSGLRITFYVFLVLNVAAFASQKADLISSGLWVCEPTIRHLLETAPASVSRGEILGRCHRTYSTAACDAAQNALFRGPSVLENLEALCGPLPDAAQLRNAGTVGAGAYKGGYTTGLGFGPLGEGVKVPGANGEPHTSFRGPISPPLTNAVELDKTTKTKVDTRIKKFGWEKPSRANSSSIDQAADAVRVFDAAGLGGGSTMQSASRLPLTSVSRGLDVGEDVSNISQNISMNVTPAEPVVAEVVPQPETVQEAGNEVAVAPYAWAPYEGDWEGDAYWQDEVNDEEPPPAMFKGERNEKPKLADVHLSSHKEHVEDDGAEAMKKEHHHKKKSKASGDSDKGDSVLSASRATEDGLLFRAVATAASRSTDTKAAVAQSESGKLLGMAASAQKR